MAKPRKRKPGPKSKMSAEELAQKQRDRMAARNREASLAIRDIGTLPKVKNSRRKSSCKRDFGKFCKTYLGEMFPLDWSEDHLEAIKIIQRSVLKGGLFALAMPRGSGKTTLALAAVIWAAFYGHRLFVVIIAASADKAVGLLDNVKTAIETNQLLAEDFPEICYPIAKLGRVQHRQKGQLYKGEPTRLEWGTDRVVLPTLPRSAASGAVIATSGMKGSEIRGQQHLRPDGTMARPDFAMVDDPQTTESAWSPTQCRQRKSIIAGDVLGMAGPGRTIAAVMPCTVIRKGDMADEILNPEKHPIWQGRRTKMLVNWPINMGLWEEYRDVRSSAGVKASTEFYRKRQKAMDEGAVASWAERFEPDEVSAIQHAMNLYYDRGADVFASEFQNEPIDEEDLASTLTADEICGRVNNLAREKVPLNAEHVTAFIDVQGELLFWLVVAVTEDFTASVIDYGTWPDQQRRYFTLADARRTLSVAFPTKGLEGRLFEGLSYLYGDLNGRKWEREDGSVFRLSRCLVDANWGESTKVVKEFCRRTHGAPLLPSHGKGYGASSMPIGMTKKKPGERRGDNWFVPPVQTAVGRHLVYDTNYWKSFVQNRLQVEYPEAGSLSLFGSDAKAHECLADHLSAEYPVRVSGRGREVDEWKLKPGRDNHWLDCLVGAMVAASMQGAKIPEAGGEVSRAKREKVKFSERQREARRKRA